MKDKTYALYRRFLNQEATDEEIVWLLDFFDTATTEELHELVRKEWESAEKAHVRPHPDLVTQQVYQSIRTRIENQQAALRRPAPIRRFPWRWLSAAAVLCVALLLGYDSWNVNQQIKTEATAAASILPGTNRATLTMADGPSIDLSSEQDGIVIGADIAYLDGTRVLNPENDLTALETAYGMLRTPRGGIYHITLADGTKAWLNAATTLKYPLHFDAKERVVELIGEAYFEVAHQEDEQGKRIPFLVKTAEQIVEVLGTRFNVMAYPEEPDTRTTLLEGSVRLQTRTGNLMMLAPGEEARLLRQKLSKYTVDMEQAAAWKAGYFVLNHYNVETFMRQLARWYDIDIVYEGKVPTRTLSGKISRKATLANVIEMLRYFDLNCHVQERTLVVGSMVKPVK